MDDKCKNCESGAACVPFFLHENAMMHYNRANHRLELGVARRDIMSLALYDDVGRCVYTGKPLLGFINMRSRPSGYYIIRLTTIDQEHYLRFYHTKNK